MTSEGHMALSLAPRISTAPQAPKSRQGVPAFLQKLHEMLNDPNSQDLIRWADAADSFFVLDHERFAREILPRWFKHQNFASFVRQLNMYGFHKIPHLQQGVLRSDTGENEYWNFAHENFRRDQPDLLCLIHRKKGSSNVQQQQPGTAITLGPEEGILDVRDPNTPTPQSTITPTTPHGVTIPGPGPGQVFDINSVLQGIAAIKKHQTTISEELQQLKQSNQLLWQESMAARERLQKNEDTVQRIVKFLAGVFGNRRGEGAHPGHHEHTHAGPGAHEGKGETEGRNEGAVVPIQRRQSGTPGTGTGAGGRRPRLMIEGAKDTPGKGASNVGIVEVRDNDADDVVNIIVEDDEHDSSGDEDDRNTEMADSNIGGSAPYNNNYAVETPISVSSPSPSIAQSDTAGPPVTEASLSPSVTTNPSLNLGSSGVYGSSSSGLNDTIMHDSSQPSSANTSTGTNSTAAAIDRAITPSRLTAPSPPPPLQLQSAINSISSLTTEQLSLLLSFLSQSDLSSIDPNLGFPPAHPDNTGVNPLSAFAGGAPSPSTFDFSSLGGLGSPGFPGLSPGLGVGTNYPALLTGSSTQLPAGTASTPPSLDPGSEHLLALEPGTAAVSPRLERHWKDVQDVDKDVSESENQIHHLIDSLGPILLNTGPFSGLGPPPQMNDGSMMAPISNMTAANASMKNINMLNASSSNSTTAKANGGSGSRGNHVDDADTDISSLDPARLSIPTGLENTDFDFDSFFPHNSSNSSSSSSINNNVSSSGINMLTAKPGVIDSTMDINFDMDDISGIGGISGYNDLNAGPETTAFLNDIPSPAMSSIITPGSPVHSTKAKSLSTPARTTNPSPSPSGIGRKRKSDVMAMGELEGALLGAANSVVKDGSGVMQSGEAVGTKTKRRKD